MTAFDELVPNSIAGIFQANYQDLRQEMADQYWDERIADDLEKEAMQRATRKQRAARVQSMKRKDFNLYFTIASNVMRAEGFEWDPRNPKPWPTSHAEEIAKRSGQDISVIRQLDIAKREPTISEVVALAVGMDVDLAYFLTPTITQLDNDEGVELGVPQTRNPLAHEYLLWIRGIRALPSQNKEVYLKVLSSPRLDLKKAVTNKKYREWRDADNDAREVPHLGATSYVSSRFDINSIEPLSVSTFRQTGKKQPYTEDIGRAIVRNTFGFFTAIRICIQVLHRSESKDEKESRFVNWRRIAGHELSMMVKALNSFR